MVNPDVIAINPIKDLGLFDVEIITAEVKSSLSNWRHFFFEAVSHKRFSERSYFIVRATVKSNDQRELADYAEKYGVGLIFIDIDDNQFDSLTNWQAISDTDRASMIDCFLEIIPARYERISIYEKIKFLKRVGIKNEPDIFTSWIK